MSASDQRPTLGGRESRTCELLHKREALVEQAGDQREALVEQAVITSKRCRSVSQQAARRALSNRALKPRSARLPWCPLADPLKPCSAIDCGAPAWPLSSNLKSRSATGCVSAVSTRLCLAAGGCLGLIPTSPERSILQQTDHRQNLSQTASSENTRCGRRRVVVGGGKESVPCRARGKPSTYLQGST